VDPTQPSARVNRRVLVTDPEAAFSMQQRQAEVLAEMMSADSSRIDTLFKDVGAMRGTVEVVHSQVNDVKAGVDKLSDALAVMVRHELTMEHTAAAVRSMADQQGKLADRLHSLEVKAPGWDELRVWVIRAGLGVLGVVGMAVLLLVMKSQGGA
jgi:preprotein translocase subunit Sss1